MPEITKSTRHAKILGNFGENLILYLLSKYGFECALVDHTGIDVIAKNKQNSELMGISVKSRTREQGTENTSLDISRDHFDKVDAACKAFDCVPYLAIVIDENESMEIYIISEKHLFELYSPDSKKVSWSMSNNWRKTYATDDEIIKIHFNYETIKWW